MRAGSPGSLPQWLEIIMTLAEADASTGWVTAHANLCAGLIYASAEPRFRDEFFADPGACAAWSNLPRVKVKEQDDGIRITGSWGFESGCTAATFVGGMVSLSPFAEGGPPRMVAALAPMSEAKIEETGIRSASPGREVTMFTSTMCSCPGTALSRGLQAFRFRPIRPRSSCRGRGSSRSAPGDAPRPCPRALDEARHELRGKTDRYTQKPLLEHPATQRNLEAAEGLWFACRAGMREALAAMWESALRGEPATADLRINARVAAVTAVQEAPKSCAPPTMFRVRAQCGEPA